MSDFLSIKQQWKGLDWCPQENVAKNKQTEKCTFSQIEKSVGARKVCSIGLTKGLFFPEGRLDMVCVYCVTIEWSADDEKLDQCKTTVLTDEVFLLATELRVN